MEPANRKSIRLSGYSYNSQGMYFVTVCVKEKRCILSKIVGDGVLDVPRVILSDYGKIAEQQIYCINETYSHISINQYVIMPNHIHLLIEIKKGYGTSRTPSPTNEEIPRLVSTFKRFCNKKYGENIWQRAYNDHIIRDEEDYINHLEYIDNNPLKWNSDEYYTSVVNYL